MNHFSSCLLHTAVWGVMAMGVALPGWASDSDHERARQALLRGDVLPLTQLLQQLNRQRPGGQVLEVELEQKSGRWVYEIKQLEPGGQLVKIKLDARTGELLPTRPRRTSSEATPP